MCISTNLASGAWVCSHLVPLIIFKCLQHCQPSHFHQIKSLRSKLFFFVLSLIYFFQEQNLYVRMYGLYISLYSHLLSESWIPRLSLSWYLKELWSCRDLVVLDLSGLILWRLESLTLFWSITSCSGEVSKQVFSMREQ